MNKQDTKAVNKPMKTKVSIKANHIIVLPNKVSFSSGLRATDKL